MVDYNLTCAIPDDAHGFTISPRVGTQICKSSPIFAVSDLDLADDIALFSNNHVDAQDQLTAVEQEALIISLKMNHKKTEYMLMGDFKSDLGLTVIEGPIVRTNNFNYFGSLVVSSNRDFEVRRVEDWQGLVAVKCVPQY